MEERREEEEHITGEGDREEEECITGERETGKKKNT